MPHEETPSPEQMCWKGKTAASVVAGEDSRTRCAGTGAPGFDGIMDSQSGRGLMPVFKQQRQDECNYLNMWQGRSGEKSV